VNQRKPRPPQKNFPRATVIRALMRTKERLALLTDEALQDASRRALAQGIEMDTRPMRAAIEANHKALLLIICTEFGVDPKEIGLD
jgi:hypothetical protein